MRSFVALSVVLLAASASASSVDTITLRKLNRDGAYLHRAADADHARVMYLKSRTANGSTTVPTENTATIWYTTTVGVGSPPKNYTLIVDTGSALTICGIRTPYVRTSTSTPTGQTVNADYGMSNMTGKEYLDQVTLARNLVLKNQSISGVNYSYGFHDVDGILGLGPGDLTLGKLSPNTNKTVPTVLDNLVAQKLIHNKTFSIFYSPSTNDTEAHGALTYGGVDSSLYQGEVMYVPMTDTDPAAKYWGVNITLATYGNHTVIPNSTAGIVDSGSTLVHLEDKYFSAYVNATEGKWNSTTRMLEIPAKNIQCMQPLNFSIGDGIFTMDRAAQLFPRDQNKLFGGDPEKYYSVVNRLGSLGEPGLSFVLGMKFMERYYTVFDVDTRCIGFAQTNYTFTTYQG